MEHESERQSLRQSIKTSIEQKSAVSAIRDARRLVYISSKAVDVMFCASAFGRVSDAIHAQVGARKLKAFVVRSVTVEPIAPFISVEGVLSNYLLEIRMGGFGSYADELLNPNSALAEFKPDVVMIVLDLEEIAGRLPELCGDGIGAGVGAEIEECVSRIDRLLKGFRGLNDARIVLQGLVMPDRSSLGDVADANVGNSLTYAVSRLNDGLAAVCRSIPDCVFFNVDQIAARFGRARFRDARMFLASRLAVSQEAFRVYARGLVRSMSALFRAPRKVLCTDLDNTLWGGVLGEDGAGGIITGSSFPGNCYLSYQTYLKELSSRGILLAIVSKNNEEDVQEAFRVRAGDLAIDLNSFVARKINWDDKSQSLRSLAEELSVGLDSFVLVDDNPVECEAVRQQLPEVAVIEVPVEEPWNLVEVLGEQDFFDAPVVTIEDANRGKDYKAQAQRAQVAASARSRDEFLGSLGIVCTFQTAMEAPLARAVQLLAKTNQFNLTTRRRSAGDVERFASADGGQAVVVRVRDRFGDVGAVGMALAQNRGEACYIDSLLLSCRVIGRGIETALLAHVAEQAQQNGATRLVGEFIATKKNAPCARFYLDHGFVKRSSTSADDADSVYYELDLAESKLSTPNWITLEGETSHEYAAGTVFST